MKKIISLLLTFILVLSLVTLVNAEGTKEYFENISFIIPEGYEKIEQNEDRVLYSNEEAVVCLQVIKGINTENLKIEEVSASFFDIYDEEYIKEIFSTDEEVTFTSKYSAFDYTEKGVPIVNYSRQYLIWNIGYEGEIAITIFFDNEDLYILESIGKNTYNYEIYKSIQLGQEKYAPSPDGNIKILVNGEVVTPDSPPIIINDRTLCPIRAVAEELGFNVSWDAETKTAEIKNNIREIKVTIGKEPIPGRYLYKGLFYKDILWNADVPARIINDRTYLPLRAVGEALDCSVYWNAETRTVIINSHSARKNLE